MTIIVTIIFIFAVAFFANTYNSADVYAVGEEVCMGHVTIYIDDQTEKKLAAAAKAMQMSKFVVFTKIAQINKVGFLVGK